MLAYPPCERPGIDAAYADHPAIGQPFHPTLRAGGVPGGVLDLSHDDRPGMSMRRLEQVIGGSVVADHGIGERDHLTVI